MDYVAHGGDSGPEGLGRWAAAREAEGVWAGISVPDHLATLAGTVVWPHVFVALAEVVHATTSLRCYSAFGNNLARSPVEFAQASLHLAHMSGGRYDAALGAGWARDELHAIGTPYPTDAVRAQRFVEALRIVRDLLHTGASTFEGRHYKVDVHGIGPLRADPPPLVAAVAGEWTMKHVPPLVDRVELAFPGAAHPMRGGEWDTSRLGLLTRDDVARAAERVGAANPAVPLSASVFVFAGDPAQLAEIKQSFGDGLLASFVGEPAEVAANLRGLGDIGIDRLTLMGVGHELLAPHLQP